MSIALGPNSHIQEDKSFSADIIAGRRPRGPGRLALVEDYIRRAGITDRTGVAGSSGIDLPEGPL